MYLVVHSFRSTFFFPKLNLHRFVTSSHFVYLFSSDWCMAFLKSCFIPKFPPTPLFLKWQDRIVSPFALFLLLKKKIMMYFFPLLLFFFLPCCFYSSIFFPLCLSVCACECMCLSVSLFPVFSLPVCLGHILMHDIPSIKLWLNAECVRTWQLSG